MNLSAILVSQFITRGLVLSFYVAYLDKDDSLYVEFKKSITWNYFGEEEPFNVDDFEENMQYEDDQMYQIFNL